MTEAIHIMFIVFHVLNDYSNALLGLILIKDLIKKIIWRIYAHALPISTFPLL